MLNQRMIKARRADADRRIHAAIDKILANPTLKVEPPPTPRDPFLRKALQEEWLADLLEQLAERGEQRTIS